MDCFAWTSRPRQWFLTGVVALLLLMITSCGQPAAETSSIVEMPPVLSSEETTPIPPIEPQSLLEGTFNDPKAALVELNEQTANSLDEVSDRTADAIQETQKKLQQSLKETAKTAGESLEELNEAAAQVIESEMEKAANAIQSELENATDLSADAG
jgi:gas vesicle protein